jgi:hypothetical protein
LVTTTNRPYTPSRLLILFFAFRAPFSIPWR